MQIAMTNTPSTFTLEESTHLMLVTMTLIYPIWQNTNFLIQLVSNNWTRVHLDNLYMSMELASAVSNVKTLISGVARTNHSELCEGVIQKEKKIKKQAKLMRETTKVAMPKDDHISYWNGVN